MKVRFIEDPNVKGRYVVDIENFCVRPAAFLNMAADPIERKVKFVDDLVAEASQILKYRLLRELEKMGKHGPH